MFVGNILYMKNSCSKMPGLMNINSFEEKESSISRLAGPWQGSLEILMQAKHSEARPLPFRAGPIPGKRPRLGTVLERLCSSWQWTKVHFFFCSQVPWQNESASGPWRCVLQQRRPGRSYQEQPQWPACSSLGDCPSEIPKRNEALWKRNVVSYIVKG